MVATMTFYTTLTIWLMFCTFVGGAILSAVSPGIGYVNAAFLATSAIHSILRLNHIMGQCEGIAGQPMAHWIMQSPFIATAHAHGAHASMAELNESR
jgi:hypothetical protein